MLSECDQCNFYDLLIFSRKIGKQTALLLLKTRLDAASKSVIIVLVLSALSLLILLLYLPFITVVISQPLCLHSVCYFLSCVASRRVVDWTVTLRPAGPLRRHLHGSCCPHLRSILPAPGPVSHAGVSAAGTDVFDATCRGKALKATRGGDASCAANRGPPRFSETRSEPFTSWALEDKTSFHLIRLFSLGELH